eukprot:c52479_g1_i1.p1 GENE.c52479_g1_i1~~c52479_g1_i1.p1  ORF type:complete len:532 (+),score=67.67 c52479_g1_i1:59-1654(+)
MSTRDRLIEELLTTEQTYCRQLDAITEVYIKPLREEGGEEICSERKFKKIFTNLETVYPANKGLLASLIEHKERAAGGAGDSHAYAQILTKHFHFFRIYIPFVNNYETMLATLRRQMRKPKFFKFVESVKGDPRCMGLDLNSLLITPVQRLPRYKLLLENLIKATEDEAEKVELSKALQAISFVAAEVNRAVKDQERNAKLLDLQKQFVDKNRPNLVEATRRFIRQDTLIKTCRKKQKEFEFLMFTDALMYAIKKSKNGLEHRRTMYLRDLRWIDHGLKGDPNKPDLCIQILHPEKSFEIICKTEQQKAEWLKDLSEAKLTNESDPRTSRLNLHQAAVPSLDMGSFRDSVTNGEIAPVWIPDDSAQTCTYCKSSFTMVRRRHHCRRCGNVVCNKCSKEKVEGQRTCTSCFIVHQQTPRFRNTTSTNDLSARIHAVSLHSSESPTPRQGHVHEFETFVKSSSRRSNKRDGNESVSGGRRQSATEAILDSGGEEEVFATNDAGTSSSEDLETPRVQTARTESGAISDNSSDED